MKLSKVILFEGPDGPVTIRPPSYGAFKRLRREREQLADALTEQVAQLPDLGDVPEDDDQSPEARAERQRQQKDRGQQNAHQLAVHVPLNDSTR